MTVLERASSETLRALRSIRASLSAHVGRRGDRLEVRYHKGWVAFRSHVAGRAFAEVRPGKRGIEAFLLPPKASLRDSGSLVSSVPPSRGWGWFRSRLKVENGDSTDVAADLFRQSYEYARKMPGRPPRRRLSR